MSRPENPALTDPDRLEALRETGLLDEDPDPALQRLARLAARLVDAPVSLVSLVDGERQFFTAQVGLDEPWASRRETPMSHSFCQHVVTEEEALVVDDAPAHPLVRENPAIRDLGVKAYAGMPLRLSSGEVLGSFCVIDGEPRSWSQEELETLADLAASAITEIELRRTAHALDRSLARIQTLRSLIPVCSWCRKIRDDDGFWESLEAFLRDHVGADVSHGICPECARRVERGETPSKQGA